MNKSIGKAKDVTDSNLSWCYEALFFVRSLEGELWLLRKPIQELPFPPFPGLEVVLSVGDDPFTVESVKVITPENRVEIQMLDDKWDFPATNQEIEKHIAKYYGDWELVDGPGVQAVSESEG